MLVEVVLLLCVLSLFWVLLSHYKTGWRHDLPPGSLGVPLLGETLELVASKATLTSHPFFESRRARYGDVFKSYFFGRPHIVSMNPEVNAFILRGEAGVFRSCYPIDAYKGILGKNTMVEIHGQLHGRLHALALKTFSCEEAKGRLFEFIQALFMRRLSTWQDQIVHVHHEASFLALNLLFHLLIGQDVEASEVYAFHECCSHVKSLLAFPFNIPGSGFSKHFQGRKALVKYLEKIVATRRNMGFSSPEDFLDALLKEEHEGMFPEKSSTIVDTIVGLLLHGEEALGSAMTLALKFLSEHPQVLNKIKEEHLILRMGKGRDEKLSWDDYKALEFTKNLATCGR